MVLILAGLSTRPERAGITSLVRVLELRERAYRRLLHLFHSSGLDLKRLTDVWIGLVLKLFMPVQVGDYLVCLADGIKVGNGRQEDARRAQVCINPEAAIPSRPTSWAIRSRPFPCWSAASRARWRRCR